ncbi:MAG: hypothetical protein QMC95_06525 [Desulfitobacteriaceae bacterium]|nr:hypothetical protein [Desulfitobacteriaceae bacterium]
MIQAAKDLITEILKTQCGVTQIYRDDDAFERIKSNPCAILLANKEELNEKKRKVSKWADATDRHFVRSQVYERILPVEVNIFHKTEDLVNDVLQMLLANLPGGMDDGKGNWVPIEPATIEWPPDQKERALAVLIIKFISGVYKDHELPKQPPLKTGI